MIKRTWILLALSCAIADCKKQPDHSSSRTEATPGPASLKIAGKPVDAAPTATFTPTESGGAGVDIHVVVPSAPADRVIIAYDPGTDAPCSLLVVSSAGAAYTFEPPVDAPLAVNAAGTVVASVSTAEATGLYVALKCKNRAITGIFCNAAAPKVLTFKTAIEISGTCPPTP